MDEAMGEQVNSGDKKWPDQKQWRHQEWGDDFIEYWASDVGARVSVAFWIGCVQNSM